MRKKKEIDITAIEAFYVEAMDGIKGLSKLPNNSIKLLYGSPPYPNAIRNYGNWNEGVYLEKISGFLDVAVTKLRSDGFLVLNVKANRTRCKTGINSRRSLIVEKLAIALEEHWHLYCVDIEIWVKSNPVPTGLKVACQDAYEQNLWFSKAPDWKINIDAIRVPYKASSINKYKTSEYHPRTNGLGYVTKNKWIAPNPLGALPKNVIYGSVATNGTGHQAVQPEYLAEKYIKAVTNERDLVVDPWLGSGTTGIVAVKLGRLFVGFDIIKDYVDIARQRINLGSKNEKEN